MLSNNLNLQAYLVSITYQALFLKLTIFDVWICSPYDIIQHHLWRSIHLIFNLKVIFKLKIMVHLPEQNSKEYFNFIHETYKNDIVILSFLTFINKYYFRRSTKEVLNLSLILLILYFHFGSELPNRLVRTGRNIPPSVQNFAK